MNKIFASLMFALITLAPLRDVIASPLHEAVDAKQVSDLVVLLSRGADPNLGYDHMGETPLHIAALVGFTDAIKPLKSAGAELDAKANGDRTPLYYALWSKRFGFAQTLIDNGANVASTNDRGETMLFALCEDPSPVATHPSQTNRSATDILSFFTVLVNLGLDVNARAADGATALHACAAAGYAQLTARFAETGAEINIQDKNGYAPLHIAAGYGQTDVVRTLLEKGADVELKSKEGTALEIAAAQRRDPVVRLLLRH